MSILKHYLRVMLGDWALYRQRIAETLHVWWLLWADSMLEKQFLVVIYWTDVTEAKTPLKLQRWCYWVWVHMYVLQCQRLITNVKCLCPDTSHLIRNKLACCIPVDALCMGLGIPDLKKLRHEIFISSVLHFLAKYFLFNAYWKWDLISEQPRLVE